MNIENIIGQQVAEPRRHHYYFAHQFLPAMFLHNQEVMLPIIASSNADEVMVTLWNKVGKQLPQSEVLEVNGLYCVPMVIVGTDMAAGMVIFPPAENPLEAIYAAVLFQPSTEKCRYIVLERSRKFLMICEHTLDGHHRNLGFGIHFAERQDVSSKEFLALVLEKLPIESWN